MKENIYGEESNTFSNALGASITVKVEETPEQTAEVSIYCLHKRIGYNFNFFKSVMCMYISLKSM